MPVLRLFSVYNRWLERPQVGGYVRFHQFTKQVLVWRMDLAPPPPKPMYKVLIGISVLVIK